MCDLVLERGQMGYLGFLYLYNYNLVVEIEFKDLFLFDGLFCVCNSVCVYCMMVVNWKAHLFRHWCVCVCARVCNHRQSRTVHQNSTIRPRTTSQSRTVHDLWIRANGCKLPTLAYRGMLKKKKITCTGLGPRFSAERSHTSWVSAILHTKCAQFAGSTSHTRPRLASQISESSLTAFTSMCVCDYVCTARLWHAWLILFINNEHSRWIYYDLWRIVYLIESRLRKIMYICNCAVLD